MATDVKIGAGHHAPLSKYGTTPALTKQVPVSEWTVSDVVVELQSMGIDSKVCTQFQQEKIDGAAVCHLSDDDLQTLGISAMGDRRKIIARFHSELHFNGVISYEEAAKVQGQLDKLHADYRQKLRRSMFAIEAFAKTLRKEAHDVATQELKLCEKYQGRKPTFPFPAKFVFIDNTNMLISGKQAAGQLTGHNFYDRKTPNETLDPRFRPDYGAFIDFITGTDKGKQYVRVDVSGSIPPPTDSMWSSMERDGWFVSISEHSGDKNGRRHAPPPGTHRGRAGKGRNKRQEKGTDIKIGAVMSNLSKHLVYKINSKCTLVLLAGDWDFEQPTRDLMLEASELKLEIFAWKHSRSSKWEEFAKDFPGRVRLHDLSLTTVPGSLSLGTAEAGDEKAVLPSLGYTAYTNRLNLTTERYCVHLDFPECIPGWKVAEIIEKADTIKVPWYIWINSGRSSTSPAPPIHSRNNALKEESTSFAIIFGSIAESESNQYKQKIAQVSGFVQDLDHKCMLRICEQLQKLFPTATASASRPQKNTSVYRGRGRGGRGRGGGGRGGGGRGAHSRGRGDGGANGWGDTSQENTMQDQCKYYLRGTCKFGENCRNSHTSPNSK